MKASADTAEARETPVLPTSEWTSDLQSLLESREGFRLLVESVQDFAVFTLDLEGRVATWNAGAERLLGYRDGEIVGHDFARFFTADDVEKGAPAQELKTALAQGRASDDRWHVRKDGTYFFGNGVTTPLRDDRGVTRGFVKVMRDQTDKKRMEEELHSRAEELARADREKDEFLAVLAHELRNPLAPIFYALHLLDREPEAAVPRHARNARNAHNAHNARDIVERQVHRLAHLIDDLLDVNRISTGKIELRKARVLLRRIVENAVETTRPLLDARGHELTVLLPEEEVWVEADAHRLEQVLANLLNNAAKFTDDGGRIWITAERPDDHAILRVKDTGAGMPPDLIERVFDLFAQGNRSLDRPHGGLGIGLTLARRLVEMHGGTIEAHSEGVGRGSEIVVRLPVLPRIATPKDEPEAPAEVPQRPLRLLVVDDSQDTAEMMSALLSLDGHDVWTAHSGPAALEAAAAHRPDAIVLDIGLPGLDGYQVAQRLRQDPAMKGVTLIAASGYGQEADRQRAREAGFDYHLVKPVDPRRLQEILAGVRAASPALD
ncbi:MAG TPA: ATP-binding protein [Thermoanaerobaculia bacterium]|jgi:PAS domain S-box-containing protein|nr:ATP-binding protein [Thermoanaerobaculia bacterium]